MIKNKYNIDIILSAYNSETFLLNALKSIVC